MVRKVAVSKLCRYTLPATLSNSPGFRLARQRLSTKFATKFYSWHRLCSPPGPARHEHPIAAHFFRPKKMAGRCRRFRAERIFQRPGLDRFALFHFLGELPGLCAG